MSDQASLPLVSIVIPHYNRADLLAETLQSVEMQEYPNWEVVVVDDGSTPEQWGAIRGYAKGRTRIIQRADGIKGPSRCRNLGAKAAQGEYFIFLDSDDLLAPWCLAQRTEFAQTDPHADFWVSDILLFREKPGDMDVCWNRLDGGDDLERFLRSDPPWHTSSPLWRRRAFFDVGGFNESVLYGDDAELHARAILSRRRYCKLHDGLPDAFVRRGDQPRITSRLTPEILESRRVRLREGTRVLREVGARPKYASIWEGQYFSEGEELLFNLPNSAQAIEKVLQAWALEYSPARMRKFLVTWYFRIGIACRSRFFWVLRVTRRIVRVFLPSDFFPGELGTSNGICPPETRATVCRLLDRANQSARQGA